MNITEHYNYWFIATASVWIIGLFLLLLPLPKKYSRAGNIAIVLGFLILISFPALLWMELQHPPMKTIGETRLWFSIFLGLIGSYVYWRRKYKWFLALSLVIALVFLFINYRFPQNFERHLIPALRSPWFIPHVIAYLVAYAFLVSAAIAAYFGLGAVILKKYKPETLALADNLVYIGFAFLTGGLLLGAIWAKEAWGHYWTWDPKEIWSAVTWLVYITYIHLRNHYPNKNVLHLCYLSFALFVLLFCWMGLNFLPAAQHSMHNFAN